MATIDKKFNPIVGFLLGWITYFIIGQGDKGIKSLILIIISGFLCLSGIVGLLYAIDAYLVCKALNEGEEIDENEYKFELAYKLSSMLHKEAVYKG